MVNDRSLSRGLTGRRALRVPEITVYFWVIKAFSTALGESTSDYLVHAMNPKVAVGFGFVGFLVALVLQFSVRRYIAWTYWFAVVMVGVFGTMAADVLHVGFGVPYTESAVLYGVVLLAVFVIWGRTERTLSIHSIDTPRREVFYWAAVVATFAMGTALGDLAAITFHLGYLHSALLFAVVIAVPALGYWLLHWNPIFSFWFAYVATRPLGASFADWAGKPRSAGGLGWGAGPVAIGLAAAIFCLVAYLAITRRDMQGAARHGAPRHGGRARVPARDPFWDEKDDTGELSRVAEAAALEGDGYHGDGYQRDAYQGDGYQRDVYQGDAYEADSYGRDAYQAEDAERRRSARRRRPDWTDED
ncbi:MAG TPA: hypothetical protein VGN41_09020 [Streptosporangiaceae bacterium]